MIEGRVFKVGDDVNTDVIFPGKYTYTVSAPEEMAAHALEDLDPGFRERVKPGDILVAGKNFGCGSSREQAVLCLKACGVGAIVARSFARIYYRNAVNAGIPAIACPDAAAAADAGEPMKIDLEAGRIEAGGETFTFPPFPDFLMEILAAGGLLPHIRARLGGG